MILIRPSHGKIKEMDQTSMTYDPFHKLNRPGKSFSMIMLYYKQFKGSKQTTYTHFRLNFHGIKG